MEEITALRKKLDSRDMYGLIESMPDHLADGLKLGREADFKGLEMETFHSVVSAGMGGSAIAGDIARSYLYGTMQIPFSVCRHYRLPGYVNRKSLVICSSYSGNTEETLAAYDNAYNDHARIIVITCGGKLLRRAESDGVPVIKIREGLPPRAALGYMFAPLLMILERLGLCLEQHEAVLNAVELMKSWQKLYENDDNPALALARELNGTIPIIYAGYQRFDAVAVRFKSQICENAEMLSFANVFPEQNHNELVGFNTLNGIDKKLAIVILRDTQEHRRIAARMEIVSQYLKDKGLKVLNLESRPGQDLDRIFYFIQYLDYTSYYLALLNGVDPYPVAAIDYLKNKLTERG